MKRITTALAGAITVAFTQLAMAQVEQRGDPQGSGNQQNQQYGSGNQSSQAGTGARNEQNRQSGPNHRNDDGQASGGSTRDDDRHDKGRHRGWNKRDRAEDERNSRFEDRRGRGRD